MTSNDDGMLAVSLGMLTLGLASIVGYFYNICWLVWRVSEGGAVTLQDFLAGLGIFAGPIGVVHGWYEILFT